MSSMVSKWPVLVSLPVTAADADDDGRLLPSAGERLFAAVREAYLAECHSLEGRRLEVRQVSIVVRGAPVAEASEVTVSAAVAEIFPDRFTMTMRVRAEGDDGIVADGTCDVLAGGEVTDEIRDELIAHAHGAGHYH